MLREFLENKPVFYKRIDYERFPKAFALVRDKFALPPVVHVVGTNGKGSTGRFLALLLKGAGRKVGHFTSPHLFSFNERFWREGEVVSWEALDAAHERLLGYFEELGEGEFARSLSYFEWATLLCGVVFEGCDEVVLEAGMGGELDATNAFEKRLSVFTPVGLDHTEMLGETLEEIALTKLRAMGKRAVVSAEFAKRELALAVAGERGSCVKFAPSELFCEVAEYAKSHALAEFLAQNLNLAFFAAREVLGEATEFSFDFVLDLPGRMQKVASNLVVDVGHNPHAANAVLSSLKNLKVNLVYNAYFDKDVEGVLATLSPVVKRVLVFEYESGERELAGERVAEAARVLGLECAKFDKSTGLAASEKYLVFGSFALVENFLKWFERRE